MEPVNERVQVGLLELGGCGLALAELVTVVLPKLLETLAIAPHSVVRPALVAELLEEVFESVWPRGG